MAKGVKKIASMGLYRPDRSNPNLKVILYPNKSANFMVTEWLPDTTEKEKTQQVTWLLQDSSRKNIIAESKKSPTVPYLVTLPPKLCGPYLYYLEASLGGKPDFKNQVGLFVGGWCEPRIISSRWSTSKNGSDVRQSTIFSYGQHVFLYLSTEGLNGAMVTIEIYNLAKIRSDKMIASYPNNPVIDGIIILEIKNTASWMPIINNIQSEEKFYIKVKNTQGKYVTDNNNDIPHARFLRIKKELIATNNEPPQNLTPAVVNQPTPNPIRYDPCKFDKIKISETKEEGGKSKILSTVSFYKGQVTVKVSNSKEYLDRIIYFDFDSYLINKNAKSILDGILKFLLSYEDSTVVVKGYACVIGRQVYNKKLSQNRSDAVMDYFIAGKVSQDRIKSIGYGEINPTDDKDGRDNIKFKDEKENIESRKTVISVEFKGHDAASIIYQTVAPGVSIKKDLTIEIEDFTTKECHRKENKHKEEFSVIDVGQKVDNNSKPVIYTSPAIIKVYSDIANWNIYPIQYIWPIATAPNKFWLHVHSCRYYSNDKNPTIKIEVYPDITWEFAFQVLVKVSNYKAQNMPTGNIYAKHNEKAREAGYERFLLREHSQVPISVGFGLSAEWDNAKHKRSFTNDFTTKIKKTAEFISSLADILQEVVNYAQGAAKATSIPIGFDIRYPKFTVVARWFLEPCEGKAAVVGEVSVGFQPLIGAEIVIDIIGCAIAAASYGVTGNPAAARIINKFRGGLEKLGASVVFTATFYGELHIMVEALKIHSIKGIEMSGKTTIEGRMGIIIELSISIEIGKKGGSKTKSKISFAAAAKGTAEGYFGGVFEIDSDEKGLFIQPILKFSGIVLAFEITGEVGFWECSLLKIEETVVDKAEYYFDRKYVINK